MNFEEVIKYLGDFGKYQRRQYILLLMFGILNGFQTMINVWFAFIPENYRCFIPGVDNSTDGPYYIPDLNQSIPVDSENDDKHCKYFDYPDDMTDVAPLNDSYLVSCSSYIYDRSVFHASPAMKFNLVCENQVLNSVWQSVYMAGLLIGSFGFGALSDKIGRKKALMVGLAIQLSVGIATPFAPEYVSYTVCRCAVAAANMGMFVTAYVMGMEMIGESVRTAAGMGFNASFAVAYSLLTGLAYWLRDWQYMQIAVTIVPGLFLVSYYWLIPESIRWSLINGRREDAIKTVKRASVTNQVEIPSWVFEAADPEVKQEDGCSKTSEVKPSLTLLDLFKTHNLRMRTINLCFTWLVISMVYYGLSLGSGNLDGDDYLNFLLMALSGFPGYISGLLAINYVGRKWTLGVSLLLGGVACVVTYFVDELTIIILSMLGMACLSCSFAAVYQISAEIFPTQLRNNGLGLGSTCARIGGIAAPLIGGMNNDVTPDGTSLKGVPNILFGSFAVVAGFLALLLPETKGQTLPDTIADSEMLGTAKKSSNNKKKLSPRDNLSDKQNDNMFMTDTSSCGDTLSNLGLSSTSNIITTQF